MSFALADDPCLVTPGDPGADAFNKLPQSTRCTILHQSPVGVRDAGATVGLVRTISSGGTPTEAEVVTGLAGAASLVGGPIAGAAMGALGAAVIGFGSALESLFDALGLYDHPKSYKTNGLIQQGLPIPSGPSDKVWININNAWDLRNFYSNGDAHHPPTLPTDSVTGNFLEAALVQLMSEADQQKYYGRPVKTVPHDPFRDFFNLMLVKNLQLWANGQPYVRPRDLLHAARDAWNSQHDGPQQCYSYVDQWYVEGIPMLAGILGEQGDTANYIATGSGRHDDPLCVNIGALKTDAPPTPVRIPHLSQGPSSAATTVVKGAAAVGGGGVLALWLYSRAKGIAFSEAWKRAKTSVEQAAHAKENPMNIVPNPVKEALENPLSTPQKTAIAVGSAVALGTALYFIFKPKDAAAKQGPPNPPQPPQPSPPKPANAIVMTLADNGKSIQVGNKQQLQIVMPPEVGTGYTWSDDGGLNVGYQKPGTGPDYPANGPLIKLGGQFGTFANDQGTVFAYQGNPNSTGSGYKIVLNRLNPQTGLTSAVFALDVSVVDGYV